MVREKFKLRSKMALTGQVWSTIKEWMEIEREHLVSRLIKENTHDKSQELRGQILLIDKFLDEEKDGNRFPSN